MPRRCKAGALPVVESALAVLRRDPNTRNPGAENLRYPRTYMASTPESKVKARCVAILKSYGAYYFYPVTGGYGRSGVPDIVACFLGRFLGVECKAGTNKPTALQEREMEHIRAAGGTTMVIREDNINELIQWLDGVKNG